MERVLDELLKAPVEAGHLPHLCAMVVNDQDIVYTGMAGDGDPDRIYRIASMTKVLTSLAVMQCIENGSVELDAPVDTYLDMPRPQVLSGVDHEGKALLRRPTRSPSIRELLTHTGGHGYGVWNKALFKHFSTQGFDPMGPPGDRRLTAPMVNDPGTEWNYSIATDFLGKVVEAVSQMDLDAYMKKAIFGPLGMSDSGFDLANGEDARLMPSFRRTLKGTLKPIDLPRPTSSGFCSGGGGLTSSPRDYARFLSALLGGGQYRGNRIIKNDTLSQMLSNHTGDMVIPGMTSYDNTLSESYEFFPGLKKCWGLGFLVNIEPVPYGRRSGSGTWAGLFNTHFWLDPSAGVAGLLMTQLLPFCDSAFMETYTLFERRVYESL